MTSIAALNNQFDTILKRISHLKMFCAERNSDFDCASCKSSNHEKTECSRFVEEELGQIFFEIYEHFHDEESLMKSSECMMVDRNHYSEHKAEHEKIIVELQQLVEVMESKSSGEVIKLIDSGILPIFAMHEELYDEKFYARLESASPRI